MLTRQSKSRSHNSQIEINTITRPPASIEGRPPNTVLTSLSIQRIERDENDVHAQHIDESSKCFKQRQESLPMTCNTNQYQSDMPTLRQAIGVIEQQKIRDCLSCLSKCITVLRVVDTLLEHLETRTQILMEDPNKPVACYNFIMASHMLPRGGDETEEQNWLYDRTTVACRSIDVSQQVVNFARALPLARLLAGRRSSHDLMPNQSLQLFFA